MKTSRASERSAASGRTGSPRTQPKGAARNCEKDIATMNRLFECRRAARFLMGDRYEAEIAPFRVLVRRVMESEQKNALSAAIALCSLTPEPEEAMVVFTFSAAIDVIEAQK